MPKTKEEEKRDKTALIILPIILGGAAAFLLTRKAAADPNKAILYGHVSDVQTEAGINNASVHCAGLTAKTNADGNYSIINIPPGTYGVTFTHPSYYPLEV